jgi:hypothetical protein
MAEEKKSRKGDGINAVLKFMIDVRDFEEKLDACVDAQAMEENKAKLEKFKGPISDLYSELAEIASGGVRNMRSEKEVPNPIIVSAPQIPKI